MEIVRYSTDPITLHSLSEILISPSLFLNFAVNIISAICIGVLIIFIISNFLDAPKVENVQNEKKSVVTTLSMSLFFILFYLLLKFHVFEIQISSIKIKLFLSLIGTLVFVIGTYVNILGRLALGKNWGDQIRIYKEHSMVNTGVYNLVRHPLYASLIWMGFGASVMYVNLSAFLSILTIFFPAMYYRASQEEKLLMKNFKEYNYYKSSVGMFFPKLKNLRNETQNVEFIKN